MLLVVERADIIEASFPAIREQNVFLKNEIKSLVYQIELLNSEVSPLRGKKSQPWGSCSFGGTRPISLTNRWKQSLAWRKSCRVQNSIKSHQWKSLMSRRKNLRACSSIWKSGKGYRYQPRPWAEDNDITPKTGRVQNLYHQLMVPIDALINSIKKMFQKLSLLRQLEQRGTQDAFVRLQQVRRILTNPDTRNLNELEGCEAAEKVPCFKNNLNSNTLYSFGFQQRINFWNGQCVVLVLVVLVVILFCCDEAEFSFRMDNYSYWKTVFSENIWNFNKPISLRSARKFYLGAMSKMWAAAFDSCRKANFDLRQGYL